ncbi:hypothetical protein QQG55_34670 [Brugia pahangi]
MVDIPLQLLPRKYQNIFVRLCVTPLLMLELCCIHSLRWRMYGCKARYHLCWKVLSDKDEWIISHINVKSDYRFIN